MPRKPDARAARWGVETDAGERGTLGAGMIVDAAIALADASGLESVTMANIAKRLGYTTMALYRHVATKDDLLTLMFDAAVGPPPDSLGNADWRGQMQRYAELYREVFFRRPWLIDIQISGPPLGPNNLRWMDLVLGALGESGLPFARQVEGFMVLNSYLFGETRLQVQVMRARETTELATEYADQLRSIAPALGLSHVQRAIDAGAFVDDPHEFTHAIDVLLDGIEQSAERR